MATVNRRICGIRNNESVLGTSMPDARLDDNKYLNDCVFDFRQKLRALPAFLQDLNATYTRNTEKRVVQDGALVTLSANQFGTSYDPVTGLHGYVPEPAATNLATYSDGNAATYGSRTNVADGTAVPGFTNGIAFGDNSVERTAYKLINGTIGVVYSVSVFVIMDDGGAPVVSSNYVSGDMRIIVDGYGTTAGVTRHIGNGVYRISASFTTIIGGIRGYGVTKQTGQSARTFRITGIQVETGNRATSYITTTGSTASRSADVLTVPLWINNVKDSQDGSTANWTRGNSTVVTSGTAPDGTATAQLCTATTSGVVTLYSNSTKAPAATVTYSIYVKQGNKSTCPLILRNSTTSTNFTQGILTFATGTITGAGWTVTNEGGGWFRCKYTQSTGISVGDTLYASVGFAGSGTDVLSDNVYFWGAQIEPGSVATAYRPTVNNLEYARNMLSFSENFGNSAWSKTNTTVTEDAAASPNGNVTADKLIVNAAATLGNSYTGRTYAKAAEAQTYTVSVRAKIGEFNMLILYVAGASAADSCQMTANLSTGAVVTSSQTGTFTKLGQTCTAAGNGYYLLTLSFTTNTDTSLQVRLYPTDTVATTGDGTRGVYIFGAQLNNGSDATEYEPTDTLTPSTNANIPGFSSAGYTLAVDQRMDTTLAASTIAVEVSNLTSANRSFIYSLNGTTATVQNTSGGSGNASIVLGPIGLTRCEYAGSFSLNNILGAKSGVAGTADTSAAMPVAPLMLQIGQSYSSSIQYNGFIFRARLIPRELTQAQLNGLTQ